MVSSIGWSLIISLAINGSMFLLAFRLKSDKLTDASYALTFITLALAALIHSSTGLYGLIAAALVVVWALRIGSFLLYRVMHTGKDRRFDGIREDFGKFGKFWLGQALTVWVLMLPVTLLLGDSQGRWRAISFIGITLWLIGFLLETVADLQKYRFTSNPAHKNQWIDSGVWRYSRHPNYFGEIIIWVGIYVFALPALSTTGLLIGFASPVFITLLLLFVSGMPILEKSADKKWGSNPAYRAYKHRTSILIPLPKKHATT